LGRPVLAFSSGDRCYLSFHTAVLLGRVGIHSLNCFLIFWGAFFRPVPFHGSSQCFVVYRLLSTSIWVCFSSRFGVTKLDCPCNPRWSTRFYPPRFPPLGGEWISAACHLDFPEVLRPWRSLYCLELSHPWCGFPPFFRPCGCP